MERIAGANVVSDKHGTGKDGFVERVAGVSPATQVTDTWLDAEQEEICNAIAPGPVNPTNMDYDDGLRDPVVEVLESGDLTQLGEAITAQAAWGAARRGMISEGFYVAGAASANPYAIATGDTGALVVGGVDYIYHDYQTGVTTTAALPGLASAFGTAVYGVFWSPYTKKFIICSGQEIWIAGTAFQPTSWVLVHTTSFAVPYLPTSHPGWSGAALEGVGTDKFVLTLDRYAVIADASILFTWTEHAIHDDTGSNAGTDIYSVTSGAAPSDFACTSNKASFTSTDGGVTWVEGDTLNALHGFSNITYTGTNYIVQSLGIVESSSDAGASVAWASGLVPGLPVGAVAIRRGLYDRRSGISWGLSATGYLTACRNKVFIRNCETTPAVSPVWTTFGMSPFGLMICRDDGSVDLVSY